MQTQNVTLPAPEHLSPSFLLPFPFLSFSLLSCLFFFLPPFLPTSPLSLLFIPHSMNRLNIITRVMLGSQEIENADSVLGVLRDDDGERGRGRLIDKSNEFITSSQTHIAMASTWYQRNTKKAIYLDSKALERPEGNQGLSG